MVNDFSAFPHKLWQRLQNRHWRAPEASFLDYARAGGYQPLREARDAFERAYFEYHLGREGGNISRVAEVVGLERTHLYRKLKQLGVKLARREE